MANVLPEPAQKKIEREYLARFVLAGAVTALVCAFIAFLTLLPSEIAIQIQDSSMRSAASTPAPPAGQTAADRADVEAAQQLLLQLTPISAASSSALDMVKAAIADRPAGISINAISSTPAVKQLALSGNASSLDAINAYRTALQADKHFTAVNVPVSALVGSEVGQFTISLVTSY